MIELPNPFSFADGKASSSGIVTAGENPAPGPLPVVTENSRLPQGGSPDGRCSTLRNGPSVAAAVTNTELEDAIAALVAQLVRNRDPFIL